MVVELWKSLRNEVEVLDIYFEICSCYRQENRYVSC